MSCMYVVCVCELMDVMFPCHLFCELTLIQPCPVILDGKAFEKEIAYDKSTSCPYSISIIELSFSLPCLAMHLFRCENEILFPVSVSFLPPGSSILFYLYFLFLLLFCCGFDCLLLLASFLILYIFFRFYFCAMRCDAMGTYAPLCFVCFFLSLLERLWKQACNGQYGHHHRSAALWTGGP